MPPGQGCDYSPNCTNPAEHLDDFYGYLCEPHYDQKVRKAIINPWNGRPLHFCWCGAGVGKREPGDERGLGCLGNINHDWNQSGETPRDREAEEA